ncbi:STAS domain-containing protein [uncultured Jannaschia sp.]|uniref:STAS domain-containing protein n=1 Tax=uncultured Jannaschia sp. TaxID=293347 RepID=UPI00260818E1|nr:STAS domain-containing protein [uncultured Jannaschia sp.]
MDIDSELRGNVRLLTLREARIDAAGSMAFKEKVRTLIEDHEGPVVIDMDRVEFLDSSGLGALVAVMKMLGRNRSLELACCGPVVGKVLTLTRMDRIFVLHNDVEAAVSARDAA